MKTEITKLPHNYSTIPYRMRDMVTPLLLSNLLAMLLLDIININNYTYVFILSFIHKEIQLLYILFFTNWKDI